MSRLYHVTGSLPLGVIVETLEQRPSPTLRVHQNDDPSSLWQKALTDGHNYVWIENDTLIAWGRNDPTAIFAELKARFAARCTYIG